MSEREKKEFKWEYDWDLESGGGGDDDNDGGENNNRNGLFTSEFIAAGAKEMMQFQEQQIQQGTGQMNTDDDWTAAIISAGAMETIRKQEQREERRAEYMCTHANLRRYAQGKLWPEEQDAVNIQRALLSAYQNTHLNANTSKGESEGGYKGKGKEEEGEEENVASVMRTIRGRRARRMSVELTDSLDTSEQTTSHQNKYHSPESVQTTHGASPFASRFTTTTTTTTTRTTRTTIPAAAAATLTMDEVAYGSFLDLGEMDYNKGKGDDSSDGGDGKFGAIDARVKRREWAFATFPEVFNDSGASANNSTSTNDDDGKSNTSLFTPEGVRDLSDLITTASQNVLDSHVADIKLEIATYDSGAGASAGANNNTSVDDDASDGDASDGDGFFEMVNPGWLKKHKQKQKQKQKREREQKGLRNWKKGRHSLWQKQKREQKGLRDWRKKNFRTMHMGSDGEDNEGDNEQGNAHWHAPPYTFADTGSTDVEEQRALLASYNAQHEQARKEEGEKKREKDCNQITIQEYHTQLLAKIHENEENEENEESTRIRNAQIAKDAQVARALEFQLASGCVEGDSEMGDRDGNESGSGSSSSSSLLFTYKGDDSNSGSVSSSSSSSSLLFTYKDDDRRADEDASCSDDCDGGDASKTNENWVMIADATP